MGIRFGVHLTGAHADLYGNRDIVGAAGGGGAPGGGAGRAEAVDLESRRCSQRARARSVHSLGAGGSDERVEYEHVVETPIMQIIERLPFTISSHGSEHSGG